MRSYSASDSMEQAVFLNRQQCVYLEKSIRKKRKPEKNTGWPSFARVNGNPNSSSFHRT